MRTHRRFLILFVAAGVFFTRDDASAISNWARKYGVDCLTCHSPAVPRLNAFGHQFRKMGYRMDTEIQKGKPDAYKEIGEFASVRFRAGYRIEQFDRLNAGRAGTFNAFHTRNGFVDPDVTLFYAGALTKNLSLFTELEFAGGEVEVQAFGEWFSGNPEHFLTIRLGQMHTLSRIGWAGFDRPSGITTPAALSSRTLTISPVPFRIGEDQRGLDVAYNFTPESRLLAGVYNGINADGAGNEGNGAGFGDNDSAKDFLVAYEQMFGESGFTIFGYHGNWDQPFNEIGLPATTRNDSSATEFEFMRIGATASYVFTLFDPKKVGLSEVQGGYFYARDWYPSGYPVSGLASAVRDGHAFWVGVEQRLPHGSDVFLRYDQLSRNQTTDPNRNLRTYTIGVVTTIETHLVLGLEGFYNDQSNDSYGARFQAMLNW